MSRWRIKSTALDTRENDYTASFTVTNMDTEAAVDVTIRQDKGKPAGDLIGACSALAKLFLKVSESDEDDTNTVRLN